MSEVEVEDEEKKMLSERKWKKMIIGEEEEKKKEKEKEKEDETEIHGPLYYFCIFRSRRPFYSWFILDTSREEAIISLDYQKEMSQGEDLPFNFGCALLESKIYIIGGQSSQGLDWYFPDRLPPMKQVLVYDIQHKVWCQGNDMNAARTNPIVVAIPQRNRIYVFGFHVPKGSPWAEYLSLKSNEWTPIKNQPPSHIVEHDGFRGHALAYGVGGIIFWNITHFCFFNLDLESWVNLDITHLHKDLGGDHFAGILCTKVDVVNNILFWYYEDDMYAYDLAASSMSENNDPLYTFKYWDGPPVGVSVNAIEAPYIIGTGSKGELCLLWHDVHYDHFFCAKFRKQGKILENVDIRRLEPEKPLVPSRGIFACLQVLKSNDDRGRYHRNGDDDKPQVLAPKGGCKDPRTVSKNKGRQQSDDGHYINLLDNLSQTVFFQTLKSYQRKVEKEDLYLNVVWGSSKRASLSETPQQEVLDTRHLNVWGSSKYASLSEKDRESLDRFLESLDLKDYCDKFYEYNYRVTDLMGMSVFDVMHLRMIPKGARMKLLYGLRLRQCGEPRISPPENNNLMRNLGFFSQSNTDWSQ